VSSNGNGNGGHYDARATPDSGTEFGELLAIVRDVKDTKIALGIIKDDVDMVRLGVGSVHTAIQRMRHDIDARDANVTQAILELTAAVNESNKTSTEALDFARRAFMTSELAERASINNEKYLDLTITQAETIKTRVETDHLAKRDSIRVRGEKLAWIETARKHVWKPALVAFGIGLAIAIQELFK
jgi:methyl-accepting chemotaxis protein